MIFFTVSVSNLESALLSIPIITISHILQTTIDRLQHPSLFVKVFRPPYNLAHSNYL